MVKVTFINGAKLRDVNGVFNAELGGSKWRAIKIFQGEKVNASGLRKVLRRRGVQCRQGKGQGEAGAEAKTCGRPRFQVEALVPIRYLM